MTTLDLVSQIMIIVCGISSIFLVANKKRWGFVIGLLGQPFWLITTTIHKQWLIFFLTFAYVISWSMGIYQWFWKKEKK